MALLGHLPSFDISYFNRCRSSKLPWNFQMLLPPEKHKSKYEHFGFHDSFGVFCDLFCYLYED